MSCLQLCPEEWWLYKLYKPEWNRSVNNDINNVLILLAGKMSPITGLPLWCVCVCVCVGGGGGGGGGRISH